jgi:hypothetical protein
MIENLKIKFSWIIIRIFSLLAIFIVTLPHYSFGQDVWKPLPGRTRWQIQLQDEIVTSIDAKMFIVDLFDVPENIISQIHANGSKVICHFSAGSYENWRPDASSFPPEILGNTIDGWSGEKWIDIRQMDVIGPIIQNRMTLADQKGCDGIAPARVNGYLASTGFNIIFQDQIDYNIWLSTESHSKGMSIGLKNDLGQTNQLLPYFDWALNEKCMQYSECEQLLFFINSAKAVFEIEYEGTPDDLCHNLNALNFDGLIKDYNLGSWYDYCRDYPTPICISDFDIDEDVDGKDLSIFLSRFSGEGVEGFTTDFGKTTCQ